MLPFLRWAGGKRWLTKKLSPLLNRILRDTKGTYHEPFLGAGSMFFALEPKTSVLSDLNPKLINTYKTIRSDWFQIQQIMKKWPIDNETYYHVRKIEPKNEFEEAAQFIWLNRTCYGGLYRENKNGKFNVPYGGGSRTPEIIFTQNLLKEAAERLKENVRISISDFECVIEQSQVGDVVYCDPTYSSVRRGQFDRYGPVIFSWSDQVRLALTAKRALGRGVTVIISNGLFDDLIPLYPNAYLIPQYKTKAIGNKARNKNKGFELLIILDPNKCRRFWQSIGNFENKRSIRHFINQNI